MSESVRIDKWLWAARFYRTRSLAAAAIDSGKIEIDGQRPKPSRVVQPGQVVSVRRGVYEQQFEVLAVASKRMSAKLAADLCRETEASVKKREEVAETLKLERAMAPQHTGSGRPTKKQRRDLIKIKRY